MLFFYKSKIPNLFYPLLCLSDLSELTHETNTFAILYFWSLSSSKDICLIFDLWVIYFHIVYNYNDSALQMVIETWTHFAITNLNFESKNSTHMQDESTSYVSAQNFKAI